MADVAPTAALSSPRPSAAALAAWFRVHRRDLPWRVDRTPYRVWLAEVMLQQTRVSVVIDYYQRFLARFPTVADLATASEDEVLSLWAGLGYYSRGRNLHKAARAVHLDHGGVFPADAAGLRALPGVGDYTAAATAAFAYNEGVPVVDGNVARVLSRHDNDATLIDSPAGKRRVRAAAAALLQGSSEPGLLSEAVMELGALVCTPKAPSSMTASLRSPGSLLP